MVDYKLIGSRLKFHRKKMKLTQEAVAEQVSITVVYLSKIENGKVRPAIETLDAICQAVHCDLGNILTNVSSESPFYQNEEAVQIFNSCKPHVKPIALDLLRQLAKL